MSWSLHLYLLRGSVFWCYYAWVNLCLGLFTFHLGISLVLFIVKPNHWKRSILNVLFRVEYIHTHSIVGSQNNYYCNLITFSSSFIWLHAIYYLVKLKLYCIGFSIKVLIPVAVIRTIYQKYYAIHFCPKPL